MENGMTPAFLNADRGKPVAKDKKKKKDSWNAGLGKPAKVAKKAAKKLKRLSDNPIVADVVAAALVAMASALKDSDKARRLANDAGDQLTDLSKKNAKHGNAMWDLALDIGRRTVEALAGEEKSLNKGRKSR
jgi:hypothetical protein